MAEYTESWDNRVTADAAGDWNIFSIAGTEITATITSSAGRNGTNGLRLTRSGVTNSTGFTATVTMPTASRYHLAFARRWSTLPPSGQTRVIATVRDSGTVQCNLVLNPDGTISMLRGVTAITGGATTFAITANTFYHFEWDVTVHNTAGAGELRINEVSRFAFTNQNTRSTSLNQITECGLRLGPSSASADFSYTDDIDDVVFHDQTSFIGDCRVGYFKPQANGTYTAWTPAGGATLADCVKEAAQDGDTTYTSDATVNDKETFSFEDVPPTATIVFLQHRWYAKKTDVGTRTFAPYTKSGATEAAGSNISPGTTYAYLRQAANIDPATGVTWTATGFNNSEFGEQVTS